MPSLTAADRTDPADEPPLAATLGREVATGAYVSAVRFLREKLAAALGDGTVRFWSAAMADETFTAAHAGAILTLTTDGDRLLTGGDDGRLCRVGPGSTEMIAETGGQWIDAAASAPFGAIAYAAGKRVVVIRSDGSRREIETASSVGGLAFAPKGRSLGIAHYGGVTLVDLKPDPRADKLLAWKGSHLAVSFSPDGRFVVSAMLENALHGWRVEDGRNMRMTGYPAKSRSLSWSAGGAWLASSGADCVVLWPFKGKDGPMGKNAVSLASRQAIVTAVACHPVSDVVAAGYNDGAIVFARRDDDTVVSVRAPNGDPVTDMVFDASGYRFGYGTEKGAVGMIDLKSAAP